MEEKFDIKEVLPILAATRNDLLSHLVFDNMNRDEAETKTIAWLKKENNILSPHAEDVVSNMLIEDDDINFWKELCTCCSRKDVAEAMAEFIVSKTIEFYNKNHAKQPA